MTGMTRGILLAVVFACAVARADDHRLVEPLAVDNRAAYVVVTSEVMAPALSPLLTQRTAGGLSVGLVTVEQLAPEGEARAQAVRRFLAAGLTRFHEPPRFVLLAGDTDSVPAFTVADIPTDHPYACPRGGDRLELAVGRLPARTPEELERMVAKTLAFERRAAGEWQRDLSFFAGVGGFSFDRALEMITTRVLSRKIPAAYDIDMTYASPDSPWFYPPRDFAGRLRGRIEEGPLLITFIGHGSPSGTQNVRFAGESHPILDRATARAVETEDACGMVVLACSTGAYDDKRACIGEELMQRPGGVAWFYGASIESAPYGNAALGEAMARHALEPDGPETVGEALLAAERELLRSIGKRLVGAVIARFTGVSTSGDEIREHVLMYNLLGDPALPLRRPRQALRMGFEVREVDGGGREVVVRGRGAPAGAVLVVTLEDDRPDIARRMAPIDTDDPEWPERVRENHAAANAKVRAEASATADDRGRFEARLPLRESGGRTLLLKAIARAGHELAVGGERVRLPAASAPR
jgi:hypothetical protein